MKLPLAFYGNPILRTRSSEIKEITDEVRKLISDMIETMNECNGIGIAANQVGETLRVFVIRELIQKGEDCSIGPVEVYINPVLSNPSENKLLHSEGCLSFPGIHVDIERPESIHIEALDLEGNKISKTIVGFKARELMHENDHLNGVCFIDRADPSDRQEIEPLLQALKKQYS